MRKEDLKRNLYMLFATYGVVLDVVTMKSPKMRGQAHVVFRNADMSTQAMRALQGFEFFGKPMVRFTPKNTYTKIGTNCSVQDIQYAKGKSDTVKKLDGTFQLPEKEEPQQQEGDEQKAIGFAPIAKAKPINAPEEKPEEKPAAAEEPKGTKRPREEESESEDEEAAMDVSDSE